MIERTLKQLCYEEKETIKFSNFSSINYLETGDITQNRISSYSHLKVDEDKIPSRARKIAKKGQIVFSLVRPNQKHYGIVDENWPESLVISTGFAVIQPNEDIDPYYLYYLLTQEKNINILQTIAEQSVTSYPSIVFADIENLKVRIYKDFNVQKKIASLLKSIDQKIATNEKINDNLLQTSLELYHHVFLDKVPNGKLKDILIEHNKSKIQVNSAKNSEGKIPFFTSGDDLLFTNLCLINDSCCYLNTGGNADVKFYSGEAGYSTDTWCISAISGMTEYLYLHLLTIKQELQKKYFQGTGLKHLQKEQLRNKPIYIPSEYEIDLTFSSFKSNLKKISENIIENNRLSTLRDNLLPLLLNGQITIR